MSIQIVVLAAGKGTRMKSKHPKVLLKIQEQSMLEHVLEAAAPLSDKPPIVVVGYQAQEIQDTLQERALYALQSEQLGTGHAVACAIDQIDEQDDVFVLCGDTPLIETALLEQLVQEKQQGADAVVLTALAPDPFGYGRIVRKDGAFDSIVEQKDLSPEQHTISEINAGLYLISARALKRHLSSLKADNQQKEYYLTDIPALIQASGGDVRTLQVPFSVQILGVNDKVQLAMAAKALQARINERLMREGAVLIDPEHTYIGSRVRIEPDAVIYPNCHLRGNTQIASGAVLYENCTVEDSVIGADSVLKNAVLQGARVGRHCQIGPFAYLRPGAVLQDHVKIGDFVEVKNSQIGERSKASHLAYIGDATVGEDVNIGCGVVFVNYDGVKKSHSVIEDGAFIGSNANLVAPLRVGERALVAAGSTVTVDVPKRALCVARCRETLKKEHPAPVKSSVSKEDKS